MSIGTPRDASRTLGQDTTAPVAEASPSDEPTGLSLLLPEQRTPDGQPVKVRAADDPRYARRRLAFLFRTLVVAVLALVVVFFAAGGWYYSGRIERSALQVGPVAADPRTEFATPKAALGRDVEDVTFSTELGQQQAWFVPGKKTTWAILVHGKGEDRSEMLRMMRAPVRAGLPALDITYRNDADSPLDPSGRYQFGRSEWRDLAAAVVYATDHGAEHVVLIGSSMGGGIVASYLRQSPIHDQVAGVVLDSPMLDLGTVVGYGAEQEPMPVLGHVPGPLTWTAERIATLRYGVSWSAVDYLDDSRWLDVPTLVFHGTADKTVPVALSRRLAARHPGRVTLDVVPGAPHVGSWNADPVAYDATATRFLDRVAPDVTVTR